jgi:hypothetical protein
VGLAARVQRPDSVRRQKDHQSAEQADEIVVIEIVGFVDQLDVREANEEERHRDAVVKADSDRECEDDERDKVHVHEGGRQRHHPRKRIPCEVKGRLDVELVHPPERDEAHGADGHQQAKQNPERSQRSSVHPRLSESQIPNPKSQIPNP